MPGWAGCDKKKPEGCPSKERCDEIKTDKASLCGGDEYDKKIAETEPGSKERKKLEKACKSKIKQAQGTKKLCNQAAKNGVKWQADKEKKEKQDRERAERARIRAEKKEMKKKFAARRKAERNAKKAPKVNSEPIPDYIMRALKPKKSVHPEYGKLRY